MSLSNEAPAADGLAAEGLKLKSKIATAEKRLAEINPDLIAIADGETMTITVPKQGKVTVTAKTEDRPDGTRMVIKPDKIPESLYPLLRRFGALVDEPKITKGMAPQVRYTLNV